jgi:hypothetical protein
MDCPLIASFYLNMTFIYTSMIYFETTGCQPSKVLPISIRVSVLACGTSSSPQFAPGDAILLTARLPTADWFPPLPV